MQPSEGFPPASRADAHILILGSLPGQQSIAAQQYYAHPRNAFWPIMNELFGIDGSYTQRLSRLADNHIALWDVLASSVRPGSLDSQIQHESARANDFGTFFATHTDIQLIAFNGKKAEQLFGRFVDGDVVGSGIRQAGLPSTSPAYAAMSFSGKLDVWRQTITA